MWEIIQEKNSKIKNIQNIFPTRQEIVGDIVRYSEEHKGIFRVIIFGSSVLPRCNYCSDLDIYIDGEFDNLDLHMYLKSYDIELDLLTTESVSSEFKKEIEKRGVLVYDRVH